MAIKQTLFKEDFEKVFIGEGPSHTRMFKKVSDFTYGGGKTLSIINYHKSHGDHSGL